jgi:hypothetical protein
MQPGDIFRDKEFYVASTGELKAKYLVVLAAPAGRDVIVRLLTSRPHGRPEEPACFHGNPYAGYYLGVPGGELTRKTWVDLRAMDDLDLAACRVRQNQGIMARILKLDIVTVTRLLECVASADDTTRAQESTLRDVLASMH